MHIGWHRASWAALQLARGQRQRFVTLCGNAAPEKTPLRRPSAAAPARHGTSPAPHFHAGTRAAPSTCAPAAQSLHATASSPRATAWSPPEPFRPLFSSREPCAVSRLSQSFSLSQPSSLYLPFKFSSVGLAANVWGISFSL